MAEPVRNYLPARRASIEGRRNSGVSMASGTSFASSSVMRHRRRRYARKVSTPVFAREKSIKSLLRNMNMDWMARLEQNAAVYRTQVIVVVLSVIMYCLETVPEMEDYVERSVWMGMEMVFTLYFTLELVLRYLATRTTGKTFLADPYVWFDIVAILPFYVVVMVCVGNPFSDSCDLRDKFFINVLQGTKILRVFKISRHFRGTKVLWWAFKESANALQVPATFLLISTTMFASLLFWVEQGSYSTEAEADLVDNGESPAFTSIVNAAYFCVVTIVTVGYGDIVPKTIVGKMITCLVMIFGVLFTAMPLAIVGNEFYNAVERDAVEHGESRRKKDEPPLVVSRLLDFEVIASRYVLLGSAMHDLGGQVEEWSRTRDGSHVLDAQDMASLQHKLRRWIRTHLTFVTPLKKVARPPGQAAGCFYATVPWSDLEEQRALNKPLTQRWSSRLLSVAHSEDIPVKAGWWPRTRAKLHKLLENPKSSRAAKYFSRVVMVLVLLSIMGFTVETMIEIRTGQWNVNKNAFFALDAFVNTFFTIEFFTRLLVSYNRRAFLKDVFNLFDFVAILPFYIDFIIDGGVPFLRLARMLRVFKVSKNFTGTRILLAAIKDSTKPLLIPLYMLVVFTLMFATALYLMERGEAKTFVDGQVVRVFEDGTRSEIDSVFAASWVILVTMTSVGYGDVTPTTMFGKGVCTLAMLFGLLYMAMPIAIVGTNFYKAYEAMRSRSVREQLNQVTVPVTYNHVEVVDKACDHARALAVMLADVDWELLRHPPPPAEPAPERSSRRVTFFTLGTGLDAIASLPPLEESKAVPAATGAPPGSPRRRQVGGGESGTGKAEQPADGSGASGTKTLTSALKRPKPDQAAGVGDGSDGPGPQSNPNASAGSPPPPQGGSTSGADPNASAGSLTTLGAPWWSSADQATLAVPTPKPPADPLPIPTASPQRGLVARSGSKRLPPLDRPGAQLPAHIRTVESHMSLLSVGSSPGHGIQAGDAAAADRGDAPDTPASATNSAIPAPVTFNATGLGTASPAVRVNAGGQPSRSHLGVVGQRIAALEAELGESKDDISLRPATAHTPIARCRISVQELDEAVRQYLSEYVALSSVLDYVRNSLKSEMGDGTDADQVLTALSSGGRRQWAQFRAALEQKRHLDML